MADDKSTLKDILEPDVKNDLERIFKAKGMAGLRKKVIELTDQWQKTEVYVALIGKSGNGKSSLINAILGLKADDDGAAKTGETETTMEPKMFPLPRYRNVILVDLPGCGTENFPLKNYLEKIEVDKYDFFIFVNSNRFYEEEVELANQLASRKRNIYFVRTKIKQDISNFKQSHRNYGENEIAECLKKIRKAALVQIEKIEWCKMPPLFIVDSYATEEYEFEHLLTSLVDDVPREKKESLVFGLDGIQMLGQQFLKEKEKYLKRRIWKVCLLSGIAAAIPIPGIGEAIDIHLIVNESKFFRQQLGLDDDSLKKVDDPLDSNLHLFLSDLKTRVATLCTSVGIQQFLVTNVTSNTAENVVKYSIPVAGLAFAAVISYGSTAWVLTNILHTMMKSANEINEKLKSTYL